MSLEGMESRLKYNGGAAQQDRMILDKKRSMLSATKYSYQAAQFTKYPELNKSIVGLFNPVSQNMDADTKLISTEFESDYHVGDIFRWENTNTFWICYTQDRTELAYFRGLCRRCDYKTRWVDGENQVRETFLSVVGPNQPDYRTNNPGYGLSIDTPTANLTVLTSNNSQNCKYFNQNQKFLLNGITYKIHQVDTLSMPGVIQMDCVQDYTNLIEDDVEEDLRNKWNIQPVIPDYPTKYGIEGPLSIKPLFPYRFSAIFDGGHWYILENQNNIKGKHLLPVEFGDNNLHQKDIIITWNNANSGAFTLCYEMPNGTIYKTHVIVESLM